MGIDEPQRLVLLRQVAQQLHQHQVLEHIGVIARVKGVAVAEHLRFADAIPGCGHQYLSYLVALPRTVSAGYFFALSAIFSAAAAYRSTPSLSASSTR